MKRTKKVSKDEAIASKSDVKKIDDADVDEPKLKFRKTGSGSFRTKQGEIIKPNQVFKAKLSDIPMSFRDVIVLIEDDEAVARKIIKEEMKPKYEIYSKGAGWYDVVNSLTGKAMNEKGLRADAASTMVAELNK